MARIEPFRALRYTDAPGPMAELVAPPYDVIDETERARLAALRPGNSIHLELPKGEHPYQTAAELLARWQRDGWLETDATPAMMLYAQRFMAQGREVTRWGLIAVLQLEPLDGGVVLPHERTLAAPKADRLNLIRACRANLSPVFGLVDAPLELAALAGSALPLASFTDRAGVEHRVWRIGDPATIARLRYRVASEQVFIADGHHRYETALAYRDERRAAEGGAPGTQPFDFILFYLCSTRDPGLVVLPTHRLLRDPPDQEALLASWRRDLEVEPMKDPAALTRALEAPSAPGRPRVGIVRRGSNTCWLLEAAPGSGAARSLESLAPPLRSLDVSLLHHVVLGGFPGYRLSYTHDEREALGAIADGGAELAALVPPPRVEDVLEISRAGLTMPQKSTYFFPKVLTGLAFNKL